MPIYEYHCEQCGENFECLLFGSETPEACPQCEGANIQRMMSACGFISKGGGGETVKKAAGTSACSGCAATSCSTCH